MFRVHYESSSVDRIILLYSTLSLNKIISGVNMLFIELNLYLTGNIPKSLGWDAKFSLHLSFSVAKRQEKRSDQSSFEVSRGMNLW